MVALLKKEPFFADKQIASCERLANQGYCNDNYLVVADGVKYIARKLLRDDIDRELEWHIHHLAYAEGITSEPLVYDRGNALMVSEFLEGEHKGEPSAEELRQLAQTLQKLHSICIDTKPIVLEIDTSLVGCYPKEYVLCHNDLNPQNIFFPTKLIDWEYAGVNDRYFDVASVCVEFELMGESVELFLGAYFEGRCDLEKLEAYKAIYKTLCAEWFENHI